MSTLIEKGETSLTVTRLFKASRDLVFAAWTEPERVKAWSGCPGGTLLEVTIDLRLGGEFRQVMKIEGVGQIVMVGVFTEVDAPSRIAYTLGPEVKEGEEGFPETKIAVDFTAKGEHTEVRLFQTGLVTDEMRGAVEEGWGNSFENLAGFLLREPAA